MLSSPTTANRTGPSSTSLDAANNTKQHNELSAHAPAFVPRLGSSDQPHQQTAGASRGSKGGRGRHGQHRTHPPAGLARGQQDRRERDAGAPSGGAGHGQQLRQHGQQRHHHAPGGGSGRGRSNRRGTAHDQQQEQQQSAATAAASPAPGAASSQLNQQQQQQHSEKDDPTVVGSSPESSISRGAVSSAASSASKGRQVAANHLLNFQYDTRSTRGGHRGGAASLGASGLFPAAARRRPPAPRHQRYDKQKFLQANFRFLVASTIDRRQYEADADRMFDWDDVILVDMASSTPVQCPISLESPPVCPQITPCGHVYSFSSIMQHLMTHGGEQLRRSGPCPLCYQPVVARELRLVQVRQVAVPAVGSSVTFQLLRRPKGSIIPIPVTATVAGAAGDNTNSDATKAAVSGSMASKWGSSSKAATAAVPATAGGPCPSPAGNLPGDTPLSDNLFAKFATIVDPRPLWRAAAQQLGHQLAQVMAEGGVEAQIEAPGLFAAADSLAQRAKRFAEHQVNQLQSTSVPGQCASGGAAGGEGLAEGSGSGASAAAAAGGGCPVWLQADPHAAGKQAEQLVRDAFTLAVEGGKAAMVAAHQEQQAQQEFPALSAAAGPDMAGESLEAATHGAAAAAAAGPQPQQQQQQQEGWHHQQQQPQQQSKPADLPVAAAEEEDFATELYFEQAFSEDEDSAQQQQQVVAAEVPGDDVDSSARGLAVAAASGSSPLPPAEAARRAQQTRRIDPPGSEFVLGTSPGTSHLLGTSPTTAQMNSASQSGDYYMYQATDGSWLFLHPLNVRCLLHAFGSYGNCPATVTGRLLELEDMVQDDSSRRRWKFLGHLPLQGSFTLGEVSLLSPVLTADDLAPFAEELSAREKRRKRRSEAAKRETRREAAAAAAAQRARQGPSAAELMAMPRLGSDCGAVEVSASSSSAAAAASARVVLESLTDEQLSDALEAQVMHDSSGLLPGVSPPGGVSFARIAQLGFAASGPALGPPAVSVGAAAASPGPAAVVPQSAGLKGAWGATNSSGKSAAARLSSGQGASNSSSSIAASSSAPPTTLSGGSSWTARSAASKKHQQHGPISNSSGGNAGQWLVLSGTGSSSSGGNEANITQGPGGAAEGTEAGQDSVASAPTAGVSSSKKGKKGVVLFATGQQRRY